MLGQLFTGSPLLFLLCDLLRHLFLAGALGLGWKGSHLQLCFANVSGQLFQDGQHVFNQGPLTAVECFW